MDSRGRRQPNASGMKIRALPPVLPGRAEGKPLPLRLTRGLTPDQEKALNHRTRRTLLRTLSAAPPVGLTSAELLGRVTNGTGASASVLNFHIGVLADAGAISINIGENENRYQPTVTREPIVAAVLLATEADDALAD